MLAGDRQDRGAGAQAVAQLREHDARHTFPDAVLATASGKHDAVSQTAFGTVMAILNDTVRRRRADRQTATNPRVRSPGMNGNYDDENPGKDGEKPRKDTEKKGLFPNIREGLKKTFRREKNVHRESMSTMPDPPSALRNSFDRERNTVGTSSLTQDKATPSEFQNSIGIADYSSDEEWHKQGRCDTPFEPMEADPQRTLVGNPNYSTDEDHPGKGSVTPYQPMPAYTGARAWQMPKTSVPNGSQTPDELETRDRGSEPNGDLDGRTKQTLDAVSSKLGGNYGKPASRQSSTASRTSKKTFGPKPQANDEPAKTSGYHSDSTNDVKVDAIIGKFEKLSKPGAASIAEENKLSSDAKAENGPSRSNPSNRKYSRQT
jgi:hypothetical protein